MKFIKWWFCNTCDVSRDVISFSEASEHGRKHRQEVNTRQVQKFMDTYT